MTTWNAHLGYGALPAAEHGLDLCVRCHRMGDQIFALARVGTRWGPLDLMARADLKTVQGILGVTGEALHKVAARLATEGVMRKVADMTASSTKARAAERLYARLKAQEPVAWDSARTLVVMAQFGDSRAQEGLSHLREVHAKSKAVSVSSSGCSGTLDSPLRGAEYHPFSEPDMSGFQPKLGFPFGAAPLSDPMAVIGTYAGPSYHPIPYGRMPVSYPRLPMGPYRGYAAGIQSRQEASYISGFGHRPQPVNVIASGPGALQTVSAQGLSVLFALGKRR